MGSNILASDPKGVEQCAMERFYLFTFYLFRGPSS